MGDVQMTNSFGAVLFASCNSVGSQCLSCVLQSVTSMNLHLHLFPCRKHTSCESAKRNSEAKPNEVRELDMYCVWPAWIQRELVQEQSCDSLAASATIREW